MSQNAQRALSPQRIHIFVLIWAISKIIPAEPESAKKRQLEAHCTRTKYFLGKLKALASQRDHTSLNRAIAK